MFFHSFAAIEYAFTLFFTVNSSANAAGDHLAGGSFPGKFHGKGIKLRFRNQPLWCSGKV